MPYFNRRDICEAYLVFEWEWHVNGWLRERPSNQRRRESTDVQLHRMGFRPSEHLVHEGWHALTDNGRAIYRRLCDRYDLAVPVDREAA